MPVHQILECRLLAPGDEAIQKLAVAQVRPVAREHGVAQMLDDSIYLTDCHGAPILTGINGPLPYVPWSKAFSSTFF
jgi:hypothetical protein